MAAHLPNCIGWCLVVWIKKSSVPERNITGNELHETIIRLGQFLPEPTTYSSWIGYCKAQKKKQAREFRVLWLSGIIWDEYIYIYWFWIKWCEKICIFNIFTPLPPKQSKILPSPASFPTDHRPNIIKQSDAKKLMSATKPSVVVFELGGLNFNLTPPAKKHPMWDGQRPSTKTQKMANSPTLRWRKIPMFVKGKTENNHKRPIKNPGRKSSRLSTKIYSVSNLGCFFHKFCRHRNYYIPIKSTTGGSHTYSMVEIWTPLGCWNWSTGPESWPG